MVSKGEVIAGAIAEEEFIHFNVPLLGEQSAAIRAGAYAPAAFYTLDVHPMCSTIQKTHPP
ncbi:hypothetical protein KSZ_18990 [Dictyobacter formicarum]|uniref:Uncharacterized protein n=1 Tax=Dictyobacter formicarum TaxID=2778368 RepID=A0ABQ3VDJ6_9CHLR|nr:hypothetical protein KSZ_18990 [Dictyobacter formicarum]